MQKVKQVLITIRDIARESAACAFVLTAVGMRPDIAIVEGALAAVTVKTIIWLRNYIKLDIE